MKDASDKPPDTGIPFNRFDQFTRKLMAVPKAEIDAEEKKYQRRKRQRKQRAKKRAE